jgi:chromosome segregation ATPase
MSFSLKPKEGGSASVPPSAPNQNNRLLLVAFAVCLILIGGVGYSAYSTRNNLEQRIATLEQELNDQINQVKTNATDIASDVEVVTKRLGVTTQELENSRKFAERLRADQERAAAQLASTASELANKANATDVAEVRQEASSKLAEVQQSADSKIGNVSGEVTKVAANLDATRADLAASRREISDVRTTLTQQIARNSNELSDLRKKGERDFFEFDIKKPKKNTEMARVGDILLQLRKTDTKRAKYDVLIQVDDSRLEKKERTANEPVQFLVGRDKLRYELVVNFVDKDRIRGYLSTPKDKVLAAERPQFRSE